MSVTDDAIETMDNAIREIATLRARVAQLEAALTKIRDNDPDGWEAAIARTALMDTPDT